MCLEFWSPNERHVIKYKPNIDIEPMFKKACLVQEFTSIQYLRAIAALMVVGHHSFTTGLVDFNGNTAWLAGGVDIFFVISGFIMVQSTIGKGYSPTQFYARRIIRIVPIYWIATMAMMMTIQWDWIEAAKSFLFIPYLNPQSNAFMPLLQPGWTLNFEMFFYLIFGLSLLLAERFRFFAVTLCLTVLVVVGLAFQPTGVAGYYTRPILLEFLLGMAIARFGIRLPFLLAPAMLFAIPFLWSWIDVRELSVGIPAAVIVASLLTVDHQIPKLPFLLWLGDASYSIYLFHLLALGLVGGLIVTDATPPFLVFSIALSMAALIGLAIHYSLEKPLNKGLKRLYDQRVESRQKQQLAINI